MDAFSDPAVESVVVMSSAQVGKTEIVLNVIGRHIDDDPSPILALQPTLTIAEAFSKDRLAPMLRDTPALRGKVKDPRSRDAENTLLHKRFPGGHVTLAGANSPASLASRPVRIALADEVDRYPVSAGTEGDPIGLMRARTLTFWNRKLGYFSTPGNEATSRIAQLYSESDQRRYWIPCPGCGEMFAPIFEHLKWTEAPPATAPDGSRLRRAKDAWLECPRCGRRIDDVERWRAVKRGEWRAEKPFAGVAGFWLWQGISPWATAVEIANAWLGALGRPEQEKVVKNTVLGLPWQESGEAPDWEKLYLRQEPKPAKLPAGVLFLTAGADVQKDRIEVSIYGWGRGKESWLVDHIVVAGDTSRSEVWRRLNDVLELNFPHAAGVELPILMMGIDSGYATQDVYAWARRHSAARVCVLKGQDSGVALLGLPRSADVTSRGKRSRRGVQVWPFNASMAKAELYGWLKLERPQPGEPYPPGWCHFSGQGEEFFRQLTAEVWQTRIVKGFHKGEWVKTRERNEALDCRNLARVAAERVGIDVAAKHKPAKRREGGPWLPRRNWFR